MYQIDQAVAALPSTPAVRVALQVHFFPSNLRVDKLPLPDNDRDMLAMRLEGLLSNLARLAALVESTGPEGYLDPAMGHRIDKDYLGVRLLAAVKQTQQLSSYLALNDAWRALDVRPLPRSAAIDMAEQAAVGETVAAPAILAAQLAPAP